MRHMISSECSFICSSRLPDFIGGKTNDFPAIILKWERWRCKRLSTTTLSSVPINATGKIVRPALAARKAMPGFPSCNVPVSERVPSGAITNTPPCFMRVIISRMALKSVLYRSSQMTPIMYPMKRVKGFFLYFSAKGKMKSVRSSPTKTSPMSSLPI